jgi:dihydrofolate reductase
MATVIVGMAMSLDGYVRDRNGDVGPLYPDFETMRESELLREYLQATGAVVMGRRSYEMGNGDFSGYEFQVPIFVLTHEPPANPARGENTDLTFTFVTNGVEQAIQQARRAAGVRDVMVVGGPNTIQQILDLGLADEVHIDLRSLLLGDGLRLFERTERQTSELDLYQVSQSPGVTHLRYRVARPS